MSPNFKRFFKEHMISSFWKKHVTILTRKVLTEAHLNLILNN